MNLLLDEGTLHVKVYLCTFSHCNFFGYRFLYIFILCDRRIWWNRNNLYRYPISFLSKISKPSLVSFSSVYFAKQSYSCFKSEYTLESLYVLFIFTFCLNVPSYTIFNFCITRSEATFFTLHLPSIRFKFNS